MILQEARAAHMRRKGFPVSLDLYSRDRTGFKQELVAWSHLCWGKTNLGMVSEELRRVARQGNVLRVRSITPSRADQD